MYAVDKLLLLWKHHDGVCGSGAIVWPSVGIVLASAVAWLFGAIKFTIPYSCVHLVYISGQGDAGFSIDGAGAEKHLLFGTTDFKSSS